MNIAFVVVKHIARGGGIEKYTEELGARLVERGHQVRVYSMQHYGEVQSGYRGMDIIPVPSMMSAKLQKLSASLYASLHASMSGWADLVHLQHVVPGSYAWFARMCKKATVTQYHGLEWKRSRWGRFGQQFLKGLERVSVGVNQYHTAVSHEQCQYMHDTYGVNVRYIPTGADIKTVPPPWEIIKLGLAPQRYILFASRLVREKGAHYLIPAFRALKTDCRLVIAGDVPGENAYKQELLELAGGDKRILFPGFVGGRLLDELFGHALLYTQPSEIEGLSIALLEAMSYGRCCLVSDIPENKEAVGEHGITFRSKDIDSLRAQLASLLASPATIESVSAQLIERVREHYSWDRIATEFDNYYHEILDASLYAKRPQAVLLPNVVNTPKKSERLLRSAK